jgi:hypothetical protein
MAFNGVRSSWAHVGEELRLVLAGFCERTALLRDLTEQARVLDRQNRLRGKCLEKLDRALCKFARLFTPYHQGTDNLLGAAQRHVEQRTKAGADNNIEGNCRIILDVRDLNWHAALDCLADASLAKANMAAPQLGDDGFVEPIRGAQLEFLLGVIKHIDGTGFGAGELGGLGDDGGEHGFQIDARIDRLRHLAKRAQLGNRFAQDLLALSKRDGEEISRFGHVGDLIVSRNQDGRRRTIRRTAHVVAKLLQARDD